MHGKLRFTGPFCGSCSFAIEHTGRKVRGVEDVRVDAADGTILIHYSGDASVLEQVRELTRTLGHGAEIESEDIHDDR